MLYFCVNIEPLLNDALDDMLMDFLIDLYIAKLLKYLVIVTMNDLRNNLMIDLIHLRPPNEIFLKKKETINQ